MIYHYLNIWKLIFRFQNVVLFQLSKLQNKRQTTKTYREFGILVGILFPLIIGLIIPKIFGHDFRNWTIYVGSILIFFGIINPKSLKYPYKIWIGLGNILGYINSHIILGTIFFLILFPISILIKVIGYDPLKLKKNNKTSYREIRKDDSINFEKIF